MGNPTLQFYVDKFLVHYLEDLIGSSSRTIETYQQSFDRFFIYYFEEYKVPKEEVSITDLTYEVVCDFLNWTEYAKNCSVNTRNLRLYAIKSFAHFMIREAPEYIDNFVRIANIPAKKIHAKNHQLSIPRWNQSIFVRIRFNWKEQVRLQGIHHGSPAPFLRFKNRRTSHFESQQFQSGHQSSIRQSYRKGNKTRIVPFLPDIIPKLIKYFEFFGINPHSKKTEDNYIFLDNTGNPYTVKQFGAVIKRLKNLAKRYFPALIPADLSAHKLRHSFAMNCLNNGMELIYLRDLLGHSSVKKYR